MSTVKSRLHNRHSDSGPVMDAEAGCPIMWETNKRQWGCSCMERLVPCFAMPRR